MEASSNSAALAQVGARGPRHRTAQLPLLSSSMPSHLTGGHTSPALVDRKFQGLEVRTEALSLTSVQVETLENPREGFRKSVLF